MKYIRHYEIDRNGERVLKAVTGVDGEHEQVVDKVPPGEHSEEIVSVPLSPDLVAGYTLFSSMPAVITKYPPDHHFRKLIVFHNGFRLMAIYLYTDLETLTAPDRELFAELEKAITEGRPATLTGDLD
jgi:hypothetical protein